LKKKLEQMHKISIIASFVCLWITGFLNENNQNFVGFFLIFSIGILHGANDLQIYTHLNSEKDKKGLVKLAIYYLGIVLAGVLLFVFIPTLALILFIIASSYHFGEQHWSILVGDLKILKTRAFYFAYGLFILQLLFYFNIPEVQIVIKSITGRFVPDVFFIYPFLLNGLVVLAFFLFFCYSNRTMFKLIIEQVFILLVLTVLFKTASLIWGFAIYFIFWHSIPSLYEQITYLYKEFNLKNALAYFKSSFLYWIISLIGIYLLKFLLKDTVIFEAVFFSFLAAITFPHAILMQKMFVYKTKKTE
jgi:Brp/Blh family beta-carotene 15,15'-monooxygenase